MNEYKLHNEEYLKSLSESDLEELRLKEEHEKEVGSNLLDAMLGIPFKNKEKFDTVRTKISIHKTNLSKIENIQNPHFGNEVMLGFSGHNDIGFHTLQLHRPNTTYVSYMVDVNDWSNIEVIDDVFKSELGNYYFITLSGQYIPLTNVVEIEDHDSKIFKWYSMMAKNFERETKLNRVTKKEE